MPPSLIVHAVDDPIVPPTMSRAYAATLRAAGRPVTLRMVAGRSPGLLVEPEVLRLVDDFVDRVTAPG